MLLTLEDQMGDSAGMTAAELHAATYWPGFRSNGGKLPSATAASPVLTPIVNRGRWLVRCPFCPSANRASRHDPRFLCAECGNVGAGGKWLPVLFPAETPDIDRVLCARPVLHNRNWLPGEKVADLVAENKALLGGVAL